jgi:hypothetical protein
MSSPSPLPTWLNTHPRDWRAGTLDRDAFHAAALALTQQPHFDQARVEFITQFLHSFDGHEVMRSVQRSAPTYFLIIFGFYLHHKRRPAEPGSGVTLSALQELFARGSAKHVFASPTRVKDMLAHARLRGMFRTAPPDPLRPVDKRIRLLEPTELLTDAFGDWILGYLRGSASLLKPPLDLTGPLDAPLVHTLFSYRVQAYLHDGFTTTERFEVVRQFMMHNHGYSVFLRLMQTVRLEDGHRVATAPASELASYRGIARATVRNTLAEAQAAGHLHAERGGQRIVLSPEFFATAQHWFAVEMLWMHSLMEATSRLEAGHD